MKKQKPTDKASFLEKVKDNLPEVVEWKMALGKQPDGYITSYLIVANPKDYKRWGFDGVDGKTHVQLTAISALVENGKHYGVFVLKEDCLEAISYDKEEFFCLLVAIDEFEAQQTNDKWAGAKKGTVFSGTLKTSSITEKQHEEMVSATVEAACEGLKTQGEVVAYIDAHTHPLHHTCAICGEQYFGWGHNAEPIVQDDRCCLSCNNAFVIPYRIALAEMNGAEVGLGLGLEIEEEDYYSYLKYHNHAA